MSETEHKFQMTLSLFTEESGEKSNCISCSGSGEPASGVFSSSDEPEKDAPPKPDTLTPELPFFPDTDKEKPSGPEPEPPDEDPVTEEIEEKIPLSAHDLQRASLAWLISQNPTAAAIRVPTRIAKYKADAAAFWSSPKKHRLLMPDKIVLVEVRPTRDACWPDCSDSDEILPAMRDIQNKRRALEEKIRELEPELRDNAVLFPEIESWDYASTKSEEYHSCIRLLKEYETALYKGSRFERIREAEAATEHYLAVPEGLVQPDELAEGWGLLYVSDDFHVTEICKAKHYECASENLLHLAQNIASSALTDVLFAHGISVNEDGVIQFRRPPRKRPVQGSVTAE